MKKLLHVLPLIAALASGCSYVKSPAPTAPSSNDVVAPTQQPAPTTGYPSTGPDIIRFVAERYPEKLAAGVSVGERMDNMRFLRDRIIESGLCGGVQLGWNLKRGGPDISNDFIVWRHEGGDTGIDIGFAYDDTSQPLRLQWQESIGPFYKEYPAPGCR